MTKMEFALAKALCSTWEMLARKGLMTERDAIEIIEGAQEQLTGGDEARLFQQIANRVFTRAARFQQDQYPQENSLDADRELPDL